MVESNIARAWQIVLTLLVFTHTWPGMWWCKEMSTHRAVIDSPPKQQ